MNNYKNILTDGRQLKAGRVILGLTINQVAEAVNLNRNSVMHAEAFHALPHSTHSGEFIAEYLITNGIEFNVVDGKPGINFNGSPSRINIYRK